MLSDGEPGWQAMNYAVKLISSEEIAKDIMVFQFEKPAGYQFAAGQFCFLSQEAFPDHVTPVLYPA